MENDEKQIINTLAASFSETKEAFLNAEGGENALKIFRMLLRIARELCSGASVCYETADPAERLLLLQLLCDLKQDLAEAADALSSFEEPEKPGSILKTAREKTDVCCLQLRLIRRIRKWKSAETPAPDPMQKIRLAFHHAALHLRARKKLPSADTDPIYRGCQVYPLTLPPAGEPVREFPAAFTAFKQMEERFLFWDPESEDLKIKPEAMGSVPVWEVDWESGKIRCGLSERDTMPYHPGEAPVEWRVYRRKSPEDPLPAELTAYLRRLTLQAAKREGVRLPKDSAE